MRMMKSLVGLGAVASLMTLMPSAQAQLNISLESSRDTFLLYEPIVFKVTLQNVTGSPVALQDHPVSKRPWLTFQIFRNGGDKVSPTSDFSMPAEVLKPGETKTIDVNITPLYKLRDSGQYDIKAAVTMAGRQSFMTGSLRFNIGKGELVWVRDLMVNGAKRTYSLIRFLGKADSSLYLRVEEVDKNLVYTTTRLGSIIGFTEPEIKFDSEGKLHLLHVSTSSLYRYSRLTADGALEYQEDRRADGLVPALIQTNDGGVQLAGGNNIRLQEKRKKLSEDQMGL